MSKELVKLPKNVAEAIERVWHAVKDDIATKHMRLTNWNFLKDEVEGHQVLDYDWKTLMGYAETYPLEYMQALVNGYEIEETPEDKVRGYIDHLKATRDRTDLATARCRASEYSGRIDSALTILDYLNIKIEGVNA